MDILSHTLSEETYAAIREQDYPRAAELLENAAAAGNPEAQYYLARFYLNGVGVPKDDSRAMKYYELSAQQRFLQSMSELGLIYFHQEKYSLSAPLLLQASERGMKGHAPLALANMYRNGLGLSKNFGKAHCWEENAVELPTGQPESC